MNQIVPLFCCVSLLCAALTACTGGKTVSEGSSSTASETTTTTAAQAVQSDTYMKRLYAKDTLIPTTEEFAELAGEVSADVSQRLTAVEYTWKSGKKLMSVSVGPQDTFMAKESKDKSVFQFVYKQDTDYNYLLYLPDGYNPKDTKKTWPVVYFFHGIGERGSNLDDLLDYGLPKYIMEKGSFDAIMIAPQCPADSHWADDDVEEKKLVPFVDRMLKKYRIDYNRMYLTGLSMGGRCTWKLALAMPDRFAAIAPVCGRTNTYDFSKITDLPVWMFHGVRDDTVPFTNINKIVKELAASGNKYFKLTAYPYVDHASWNNAYSYEPLYEWLLSQTLENRGSK